MFRQPEELVGFGRCDLLDKFDYFQGIWLHFDSFSVENGVDCGFDALRVYDGTPSDDTLLATFCGNSLVSSVIFWTLRELILSIMHSLLYCIMLTSLHEPNSTFLYLRKLFVFKEKCALHHKHQLLTIMVVQDIK